MKVHLQESDTGYKIFLYVFYVSAFIMCSITIFGFYAMIQEWSTKGTYVMGEVLVKTEFPTPHFAKLITCYFFHRLLAGTVFHESVGKEQLLFQNGSLQWCN
jgi:hypothetical protein